MPQRSIEARPKRERDGAATPGRLYRLVLDETGRIANGPEVILVDLKMPKVDGLEILPALRGDSRTRSFPVVMLTSSREERDVEKFAATVRDLGPCWPLLNQPPAL
ncbi:MAG: hypothetical protein A2133_04270 [Actinobacteria bacterium RBG_16_64_13]|nr:MAG: hypothetical protein A2133_04270 [Actinobacteria bacterium RBG_16_64_13]